MFRMNKRLEDLILLAPDAPSGADGGGDPAPTPAPSDGGGEEGGVENTDFSGLEFAGDDIDEVEAPQEVEPKKETVVTPPASATPEKKEPAAAEKPVAATPEKKEEPKPEAVPATPAPSDKPQPQAESPKDAWQNFLESKPQIMQKLATERYALSDEEVAQLESEPAKALPLLAAKVHTELYQDIVQSFSSMMPVAFQQLTEAQAVSNKASSMFKEAFPQIDLEKYGTDVLQTAEVFTKLNPTASLEERIAFVGTAVATRHKLTSAPVDPAATVAAKAAPFVPASSGAPAAAPQIVAENPFGGLGGDYED